MNTLIKECKMPDVNEVLTGKLKLVPHFILCHLIGVGKDFPEYMDSYRTNLARLVDKAMFEYSEARECVISEVEEQNRDINDMTENGRYIYTHLIANNLENCIITTKRIINYFNKIKSDKSKFPINKIFKKQIESIEKDIRDIRDDIEHMDKDINKGSKKREDTIAPVLNLDSTEIKILSHILKTESLANLLKNFYIFTYDFIQYKFDKNNGFTKIQ